MNYLFNKTVFISLLLGAVLAVSLGLWPKTIVISSVAETDARAEGSETPRGSYQTSAGEIKTVIIYAYSSEIEQTDDSPFITASGKRVRHGIIASNCLPFGSKVLVNGKEYVVEDRMNKKYSCEYFDIWMPTREEALNWGKQIKEVKIL